MPSGGSATGAVQDAKIEPKEIDRLRVKMIEKIKIKENFRVNIILKLKIHALTVPFLNLKSIL